VRWRSAIRVRLQYGYRGPLAFCSASEPLSLSAAACGLRAALAWARSHFVTLSCFPCTKHHSASSAIGHWPRSIRLKHTKHTGGRQGVSCGRQRVRIAFDCAVWIVENASAYFRSWPRGHMVHSQFVRRAVPCLQLLMIAWRVAVAQYRVGICFRSASSVLLSEEKRLPST
jgi:hypothetical protein